MRLIVTGGGTGGHLFPALAVATAIRDRYDDGEVLFIGTSRQIDNQVLAEQEFRREVITFSGIKGLGLAGLLHAATRLPIALVQALSILRDFRPDLVFAVGGYVTVPVLVAARILRVPICIHEQNSVPGLANRVGGRLAKKICISLPCRPPFAEAKTVMTGNPVRREILAAARQKKSWTGGTCTLLVLGGSQGARRVNELVLDAVRILKGKGVEIRMIHQTGPADMKKVRSGYEKMGVQAQVGAFFKNMAKAYSLADLVISRAGATTLAELAVMGLPAVLIPYPHAADDHQATNAAYYERGGGAVVAREEELDGRILAGLLHDLAGDQKNLQIKAMAMRSMARPDATEKIVAVCAGLAGVG
jgi:UDP-N-acetylglucosamine--N-acetylmuramyl-(pentapeptide) pyrophosphoryl-undecaprenol N-acetylglucosamine transferase